MIKIKNLHAETDKNEILRGINLELEKGKIYVVMGKNGSGKSTLANVIMGNPKYKVNEGEIIFEGKNITQMSVSERAKLGIFISFQFPVEIPGVSTSLFLRQANNSVAEKKKSLFEFKKHVEKESKNLGMKEELLGRYVNQGFSGGENKLSEILQMSILNPKFIILDEIDSGLDVNSLKRITKRINSFLDENKTIVVITHHARILDYLNVDSVFIMDNGKIIKEGKKELIKEIERRGFT